MSLFFSMPSADSHEGIFQNDVLTIWLAVLSIYCIDFSINAGESSTLSSQAGTPTVSLVMAVDRALLVDVLPRNEQANGNAWAAIMVGIGGVSGFFL
jgi:solute carrier family 45 protein 1/2/4